MEIAEKKLRNVNSKWLEGLVLLIFLALVLFFASKTTTQYTTIMDEQVSQWSGTIDNLE